MALALQQAALSAASQCDAGLLKAVMSADAVPRFPASPSRVFAGSPDQVRQVRDYVRAGFAGHRAADDAVQVASELAANSVEHSASGFPGGIFMVHLVRLGAQDVAVIVTDQGGPDEPCSREVGPDCETGRGLAVAHSLSSRLDFLGTGGIRSAVAVIPAARPPAAGADGRSG